MFRLQIDSQHDDPTYAVVNRRLAVPAFRVSESDDALVVTTAAVRVTHAKRVAAPKGCRGSFAEGEVTVELLLEPFATTWRSGGPRPASWRSSVAHVEEDDEGNLNGTMNYGPAFAGGLDCYSTPEACARRYAQVLGRGLLSRSGLVAVDDTNGTRVVATGDAFPSAWFEAASTRARYVVGADVYVLASGLDYKAALGDFARVSGGPSLPPLAALGVWYSRYYPYGEANWPTDVYDEYERNGLPLSVAVFDVPWHTTTFPPEDIAVGTNATWPWAGQRGTAAPNAACNGWDGFTFNRTLFPDPQRFFGALRGRGVKAILSVHAQNGIDHCQDQYRAAAAASVRWPRWLVGPSWRRSSSPARRS